MSTAAILAGGRARRFGGRDKGALPIAGRPIVGRQLDALRAVVEHLLVVTGAAARLVAPGTRAVADLHPGAGALGGIYSALAAAPTSQVLVLACDMPFLNAPFLRHVLAAGRDVEVAIPRTADGYHPLCASYSRGCLDPIRERLERGALKVADLLADVRVREIGPGEIAPFDPDGTLLFNVNTPEDYVRACEMATRG